MERFIRTELLIDKSGLAKLAKSTVAVFDIRGVGSYVVEALARSGFSELVLIDHDDICLSNINRQLHALDSTIGHDKVTAMAKRVKDINSNCKVIPIKKFFSIELAAELIQSYYNYIVDAIDSIKPKIDLIEKAIKHDISIISSMGAGNKIDPTYFKVTDISKTHTCPMAKAVRKLFREYGINSGFKVVFSMETPLRPQLVPETEISCKRQIPGSISFVPSVGGLIMASVVVKDILEKQ